jgi:hypothetical protein
MMQLKTRDKHETLWYLLRNRYYGRTVFFGIFFLSFSFFLLPASDAAEGISGYLEFDYNNARTKSVDDTGASTVTKTNNFNHLYNLSLARAIYPQLRLTVNSIFEQNISEFKVDDRETDSTTTNIRPFIGLDLLNPVFSAGVSYNKRQQRQTGTDFRTVTNVNENYNAIVGWRPEGLPAIILRYDKSSTYDKDRLSRDTEGDDVSLNMQYTPVEALDLEYQTSYQKTKNNLDAIESRERIHNGRLAYNKSLFQKRVSLFTQYNIAYGETEVSTTGTGEISTQLFPVEGRSAIDDTPDEGALNLNSLLIDGNLLVSSNINIGLPPIGGNTDPRNIGLKFADETEVNTIFVWVDRELPDQIVSAFSWDIYTSPDNENWTLLTNIPAAPFGTFQNRFEINFSNVTAEYIKVVTTPLEPVDTVGVPGDFSNIFVTEIQAFIREIAQVTERRKDTRTSHIFNFDGKARLLDYPSLYYEISYFLTKAASAFTTSALSNGFSLSHTFSDVLSGFSRVSRDDIFDPDDYGIIYRYNASLKAVPLRTLKYTLTYSGSDEDVGEVTINRNSLFLRNTAALYQGIHVNISGGISLQKRGTGEKIEGTTINVGTSIKPHRTLSFNMNYSDTRTEEKGGATDRSVTSTRRSSLGVSYRPYQTLSLFASYETIKKTELDKTFQSYGVAWSPFRDGALQFNFRYNESLTVDEGKSRLISPRVRWNINSYAFLDFNYLKIKNESDTGSSTDSDVSNIVFRMAF